MKALRKFALTVAATLALSALALDLPVRQVNGKSYYYYEVPAKETIYSITRKFGITREEIVKYNPSVIDGLRAGDVLYFPVEKEGGPEAAQPETIQADPIPEVKPEEPEEPEVKPEVKPEVPEVTVVEPVQQTDSVEPTPAPVPVALPSAPVEQPSDVISDSTAELNVAVILPFMLNAENMTRQVENHTNFYRGMLMAVDSLSHADDLNVNIYAFDSEGSARRVAQLMNQPEVAHADYIIAPPDSMSIEAIALVADSTEACVLNLFAVKNDAQKRHESVLQANIPHDLMYQTAIEGFCSQFRGDKVIVLNATDIPSEKRAFVSELTDALVKNGLPYESLDFAGKLAVENLEAMAATDKDLVFVPTSHSREALMKVLPALTEFNVAHPSLRVRLFGYPEWVVLRGDIKEKLHQLNATIYSRFSTDLDSYNVDKVEKSYKKWFGTDLPKSIPNTTLLGFDTAAWILSAAENGLTEPFQGLQNAFKVTETDGEGAENRALYFITFTPAGQINTRVL